MIYGKVMHKQEIEESCENKGRLGNGIIHKRIFTCINCKQQLYLGNFSHLNGFCTKYELSENKAKSKTPFFSNVNTVKVNTGYVRLQI